MSAVSSDPVIVEDLCHDYADGGRARRVLAGVSLRMAESEIVVVAGVPGSGKTTLLGLIGGWHAPQSGRVCVLGTELAEASPRLRRHVRRRVGLVTQARPPLESGATEHVMLALVLAFAAAPPLLLVDEPTAGLDDSTKARVASLLRQFTRESAAAVLVACADPAMLAVADRVLRLESGRLVGLAEPERTTIVYRHSA